MLTGFGAMLTEFDAKPAAVDFLLSKPMSLDELYNAIARVSN
jgi:ActR/RegA family two-component response regulator